MTTNVAIRLSNDRLKHWIAERRWTATEAALIITGYDPATFAHASADQLTEDQHKHLLRVYQACEASALREGASPGVWGAWLARRMVPAPSHQAPPQRNGPDRKRHRSLLRLIAALAHRARLDITSPYTAPAKLTVNLAEVGEWRSPNTIAEILHEVRVHEEVPDELLGTKKLRSRWVLIAGLRIAQIYA